VKINLTVPNLLSLARMGLIPLFIISVLDGRPGKALAVFVVAGLTDALDGFIARFWHQQSVLGAYLDPMADKLLLVSAYVILAIPSLSPGFKIPVWVTVLVIARDAIIVVVAIVLHLAASVNRFPPSFLSKVNTATQVGTVTIVLLSRLAPGIEPVAIGAVHLVAVLTVASGVDYFRLANRMAAGAG